MPMYLVQVPIDRHPPSNNRLAEERVCQIIHRVPPSASGPLGIAVLIGKDRTVAQLETAGKGHRLRLGILQPHMEVGNIHLNHLCYLLHEVLLQPSLYMTQPASGRAILSGFVLLLRF